MGKPVVMGRKTYQSFSRKPLPGRTNIVVSRDRAFTAPARWWRRASRPRSTPRAAMRCAAASMRSWSWAAPISMPQTMATADRLVITRVKLQPAGDTMFPPIDPERLAARWSAPIMRRARTTTPASHSSSMSGSLPAVEPAESLLNAIPMPCAAAPHGREARCNRTGSSPITAPNRNSLPALGGPLRRYSMPWSNQGGGPWGSGGEGGGGGRGPGARDRNSPAAGSAARSRRTAAAQPGQAEARCCPGGNLGGKGIALIVVAAIAIWGFSGFFRVQPDEFGVVLRFGKYVRDAQPGLNYHLPYPIEIGAAAEGHARQPHRHRHAHGRGPAPRHRRSATCRKKA